MNTIKLFLVMLLGIVIAACSGGGGSTPASGGGNPPAATSQLSGTAATGAPIVGKVVAIDANGKVFSGTSDALGAYTVNVTGGTAPFILSVTGTSGGKVVTLNSVATAVGQTVNITPLTDLIVSTASGQPGGTALADLCTPTVLPACTTALTNATTGTKLADAVTAVTAMVAPLNTTNINPLNGAFVANRTGMDGVLDQILVTPASGQGAMATVTLIAVPTQQLGTVTMPASAGGTATTAAVTPSGAILAQATTAAIALSEINVCLASLNALYPANHSTAPAALDVTPFVDATFRGGPALQADAIAYLSSTDVYNQGFPYTASGLSSFDFTPQASAGAIDTTSSPVILDLSGNPTAAWVRVRGFSDDRNTKFIKRTAYTGCPGGWKLAGSGRVAGVSMSARINKWAGVYNRELSFHIDTSDATAASIAKIVVTGPGLRIYSGVPASPVGAATPPLTLVYPPVPAAPAVQLSHLGMQGQMTSDGTSTGTLPAGSFYGNREAIQSCQDLAATAAQAGTPCYDETAVAPGAVFIYTAYNISTAVISAYPFQLGAVPMSIAFATANAQNLFAQNILPTPTTMATLNTAAAGITAPSPLDGIIKFTYTISSVYGAVLDNCNIGLTDANNTIVLRAEQSPRGLTSRQTSCTFTTSGLYSGSLAKPAVAFGGSGSYKSVATEVLGNQAVTGSSY